MRVKVMDRQMETALNVAVWSGMTVIRRAQFCNTEITATTVAAGGGFHRCRYSSPRVNNRHVNRAVR